MIQMIRKRLQVLEQAKKTAVPELVIIFWDDAKGRWIAKEQYARKSVKGGVVPFSGRCKLIPLERPEDYEPPEGFTGTIISEGVLE